jgi:hypothetical protein
MSSRESLELQTRWERSEQERDLGSSSRVLWIWASVKSFVLQASVYLGSIIPHFSTIKFGRVILGFGRSCIQTS